LAAKLGALQYDLCVITHRMWLVIYMTVTNNKGIGMFNLQRQAWNTYMKTVKMHQTVNFSHENSMEYAIKLRKLSVRTYERYVRRRNNWNKALMPIITIKK
jgi:hypothetical protein